MALYKKCDRCNGEILFDDCIEYGWHYIRLDDGATYDICSNCYKDFVEFMKGRTVSNHAK